MLSKVQKSLSPQYSLQLIMSLLIAISFIACGIERKTRSGANDPTDMYNASERPFTADEMKVFKGCTLVCFIRNQDIPVKALYEKAVDMAWTSTPTIVAPFSDLDKYSGEEYVFFVMEGYRKHVKQESNALSNQRETNPNKKVYFEYDIVHVYLSLKSNHVNTYSKRGRLIEEGINFTRHPLELDLPSIKLINSSKDEEVIPLLYSSNIALRNFSPANIYLYLKNAEKQIKAKQRSFFYETKASKDLPKIKRGTLYIADYSLKLDKKSDVVDLPVEEIFKDYKGKYQVVSLGELNALVLNDEECNVMEVIMDNTDKFIKVWNNKKGILYEKYAPASTRLKSKDIKKMVKEM